MKSIILGLLMRYLPEISEMIFDYLRQVAKQSDNKIDDQIVDILEKIADGLIQEKKKPSNSRIRYRRR